MPTATDVDGPGVPTELVIGGALGGAGREALGDGPALILADGEALGHP